MGTVHVPCISNRLGKRPAAVSCSLAPLPDAGNHALFLCSPPHSRCCCCCSAESKPRSKSHPSPPQTIPHIGEGKAQGCFQFTSNCHLKLSPPQTAISNLKLSFQTSNCHFKLPPEEMLCKQYCPTALSGLKSQL